MKTTAPIPPDPNVMGFLAAFAVSGWSVVSIVRGDGWLYTLLGAVLILVAFAILYATAHRNYKRAAEAWRLRDRAQIPVTLLDPGSIYTVDGVLSTRTQSGEWLEIGSGVATFHFKPDRQTVVLPPRNYALTEWRRKMMEQDKSKTPPTD